MPTSPDRWLSELPGTTAAIPGLWANLLTFLGGQRSCIGFKFAILEYVPKYAMETGHTHSR